MTVIQIVKYKKKENYRNVQHVTKKKCKRLETIKTQSFVTNSKET